MRADLQVPEIEPYVLSLLVVAAGDTQSLHERLALVQNTALRTGLDWIGRLPDAAGRYLAGKPSRLTEWLGPGPLPATTFEFCAHLADAVDQVARGRHRTVKADDPEPSKFDQHVIQALGQTIGHAVGMVSGVGPPTREALGILATTHPRGLQQRFMRNYIGNMLQDYFDECEVRAAYPGLPKKEEEALRLDDADAMAEAIFDAIPDAEEQASPKEVLQLFQKLVGLLWLEERRLDD